MISSIKDKVYLLREHEHLMVWHRILGLYMTIFVVWGLYRFLFRLPVWFEELFLKGLVFGVPVFWLTIVKENWRLEELGLRLNGLFGSVMIGIIFGLLMGMAGNMSGLVGDQARIMTMKWSSQQAGLYLFLALVTAFWEQLLFCGYMLKKLERAVIDEWIRAWLVAGMFALLHLPALFFIHRATSVDMLVYLALLLAVGLASVLLMLKTRNLAAPILAHTLWGLMVFLFG